MSAKPIDTPQYNTYGIGERPKGNPTLTLSFSARDLLEAIYGYAAQKGLVPEGTYSGWLTVEGDATSSLELWQTGD